MTFTPAQFDRFKRHDNLLFLQDQARRKQLPYRELVRAKIAVAIQSQFPSRGTDADVQWVAEQISLPWLSIDMSALPVQGRIHHDAVMDFLGIHANLAPALRDIFNRAANGVQLPRTAFVLRLAAGAGGGSWILYDKINFSVLGLINTRLDGLLSPAASTQLQAIAARRGGGMVSVRIAGNLISRV